MPKPWRKDLLKALVSQGHTIVPYRIVQHEPDQASVEVYDPNRALFKEDEFLAVQGKVSEDRFSGGLRLNAGSQVAVTQPVVPAAMPAGEPRRRRMGGPPGEAPRPATPPAAAAP